MYTGKVIDELILCVERVQKGEESQPKMPDTAGATFMFLRNYLGEYSAVQVA